MCGNVIAKIEAHRNAAQLALSMFIVHLMWSRAAFKKV